MSQKLPSNKRVARQKKAQAAISITGGSLGLAALASRGRSSYLSRGGVRLKEASKWKDRSTALTTAGAGVGGVGAFNFASYTNADAKKQQRLKKNMDPFGISKKDKDFDERGAAAAGAVLAGSRGIGPGLTAANVDDKMTFKSDEKDIRAGRKPHYGKARRTKRFVGHVARPTLGRAAVGATVGAGAAYAYNKVKKADTTSAFGIDHGY